MSSTFQEWSVEELVKTQYKSKKKEVERAGGTFGVVCDVSLCRKVIWRSPKHIARGLVDLRIGWEKNVDEDNEPLHASGPYQYYKTADDQPWPHDTPDDGTRIRVDKEGTSVRPTILNVEDILKEGYKLKGGDYVLAEVRSVWRCKAFAYDYCQTCVKEPVREEWHGVYELIPDGSGNYQGPGKWKLYKDADDYDYGGVDDQEDVWFLSCTAASADDEDSITLDGFDPQNSKTVKTYSITDQTNWKLARCERTS